MTNLLNYTTISSPVGKILLGNTVKGIAVLSFLNNQREIDVLKSLSSKYQLKKLSNNNLYLSKALDELNLYFNGKLKTFSVELDIRGTNFQNKVWKSLLDIPYGKTKAYSAIAKEIENENSSRAVGQANNKNPIPIIIPCHRVIGKNGDLTGYASGLKIKNWLIAHESSFSAN